MRLHLAVLRCGLALALAAAAPSAASVYYGGHTSAYAPFTLRVANDGRALTGMGTQVDFDCDDGYGASWSGFASFRAFAPATVDAGRNVFSPARISRRGAFRARGEAVWAYGTDATGEIAERLRGTVRRGVAHGTYTATLVLRNTDTGALVSTCHTGTVRWQARSAPGRVYAGFSARGEPLVIERSPAEVKVLWVSWAAPCDDGGAFETGEGLTNFAITRRGHFGDRWTDGSKLDDGGSLVRAYAFDGTIGASRAAGSFGVTVTRKDAAGNVTESCESEPDRWTARSTKGAKKLKPPKGEIRVGA